MASRISGSFAKGFLFANAISGSSTSTGSFGSVYSNNYSGDASLLVNTNESGHVSSSNQLATAISGSIQGGFRVSGSARYTSISSSMISGSSLRGGSCG